MCLIAVFGRRSTKLVRLWRTTRDNSLLGNKINYIICKILYIGFSRVVCFELLVVVLSL